MHEKLQGRAGEERFDLIMDDQSMGAIFPSLDELLQHPRLPLRYRYRGDVIVCLTHGPLRQDRHVTPHCIIHAYALHDVLLLRSWAVMKHSMHRGSAGHIVGFRGRQAEALGLGDESVFLV